MTTHNGQPTKRLGRVTLDLGRLVASGQLDEELAARLAELGDGGSGRRTLANVMLIFGALMVVAGVLALKPDLNLGLAMAIVATGIGGLLVFRQRDEWGLLGQALVLMGVLGICGWIEVSTGTPLAAIGATPQPTTWLDGTALIITGLLLASSLIFRNAVLAAFAPIALAGSIGGGTACWHASYAIFMQDPMISIGLFGVLWGVLVAVQSRVPESRQLVALVMGRVCFILANIGFWIAALWGEHVGQLWANTNPNAETAWEQTALFIPAPVFAVLWAVASLGFVALGVRTRQRFVANTAIVFLATNFYTQLYEQLLLQPAGLVLSGLLLVGLGFGLVRFDRWVRGRQPA